MQHTAHHAIKARLNLWKGFFETGHDATPDGVTDDEYGLNTLMLLAARSGVPELDELAELVALMGDNYMHRASMREAELMLIDDPRELLAVELGHILDDRPQALMPKASGFEAELAALLAPWQSMRSA